MTTTIFLLENDFDGKPSGSYCTIEFTTHGKRSPTFMLDVMPEWLMMNCGREASRGKRWLKILAKSYEYTKFKPNVFAKYYNAYEMEVNVALELLRDLAGAEMFNVLYDEFGLAGKFQAKTLTTEDMGWVEPEYKPAPITQGTFFQS